MTKAYEVTVFLRVEGGTVAHRHIGVFVGRRPGSRAKAGVLTMQVEEWVELRERLALIPGFEIGPPLSAETEGGTDGD